MITKICGVKKFDTILCCEKNFVNFFGMIFYKKSPRNINIDNADLLIKSSKNLKIKGVGVFVDEKIADLILLIKKINLKYVQLHGDEDNQYIETLKSFGVKIIKKISISNKEDLTKINKYLNVDYFLFDYKPKKGDLPGGNSKSFDWIILDNLNIKKPWFLSGGINLDNISYIKTTIKPYGIDLSSGVEKELGIKDNAIINNFMSKI